MRMTMLLLTLGAALASGEVVDRVAVSAGLQVVTDSAIRRQLRLDVFFASRALDFSPAARRDAARRLLDQLFIRREVELSRFAPVPVAEVEKYYAALREERQQAAAGLRASLMQVGLSEEDLTDYIQWQITFVRFTDFRFRPGVQVDDDEVKVYYDGEFRESFRKTALPGAKLPSIEDVRESITQILANRKIEAALDQWLEQARQQTRIRWHEESFQ